MKKLNLKYILAISLSSLAITSYSQSPSTSRNFVMETVVKVAGKTTTASLVGLPVEQANRTISYFDGLGRPVQTVQWQGSPGKKDVASFNVYDALGREALKYLPYADQYGSDGSFRTDHLTSQAGYYGSSSWEAEVAKTSYPYSRTIFEPSPLNRVIEQGAPGAAWQPVSGSTAGHTVKPVYSFNAAGDVPLWTVNSTGAVTVANYAANRLYKTITRDENWVSGNSGNIEEFKDLEGRVVMKRVWENEGTSLNTHYIYDDLGNLRYVVPPAVTAGSFTEGDANFTNFIYGYHYDGRRRLIEKKIPGKGWEHLVYNGLDQVVFTQDAVQRANSQWLFTKYDALGRPIATGLYLDGNNRAAIQAALNGMTLPLWENRDNANGSGIGTGYTNVSYPNVSISTYHTISYYDDYDFYSNSFGLPNGTTEVAAAMTKGLVTGTQTTILGTGTMLLAVNYYDADGRVVTTKSQNHLAGGTDVVSSTYNFDGSVATSTRMHNNNGAVTTIANAYVYDHMGRKVSTRENINGQGEVTLNRLDYNGIGQLKGKALHSTDGLNFYQQTAMGYNERGWLKTSTSGEFSMQLKYDDGTYAQYNGNIANQYWGTGWSFPNVYTYQYDRLNRLTSGTSSGVAMSEVLTYDVMGNIASMNRDGSSGTYYYNGNQLSSITGGLATGSYSYDLNGNATTDGRNGMTLSYNYLNLPISASKTRINLTYTYDATGQKLKKVSSTAGTTDYIDGIHYNNGVIEFIQTEEGRAVNQGGTYKYEYNLTDHLGNVRYSFDIYGGVVRRLQSDDYYAFGMRKPGTPVSLDNRYLYNGKELQEELLGQYDYGARFYDPVVGRWNAVDPLAHKMLWISPYAYCANNPVLLVDPDGRLPIIPWLLKAVAGAAADMMAQASMDYLFNSNTTSWGQAFDNVNYYQVARSGAEGLIPWRTPGGKIGRAAGTAIVDVLVNAANNPSGYTPEQAGMDFATGFIGDLAGGGFGQVLNKYGSKAVINGLMDKMGYSATQIRKMTGGFDGEAVRKWYTSSVDGIDINVSPTEANARNIVGQRNSFKQQARHLMSDQKAANNLPAIESYDYYHNKSYNKGLRGDALYQDIINGGKKTNAIYNKKYGE